MLLDAFNKEDPGFYVKNHTYGKLFNIRRLKAINKVKTTIIRNLLFADDCALNAPSESDMRTSTGQFSNACDNFGLTISIKKTSVVPASSKNAVRIALH